jgi:hypothetical protein
VRTSDFNGSYAHYALWHLSLIIIHSVYHESGHPNYYALEQDDHEQNSVILKNGCWLSPALSPLWRIGWLLAGSMLEKERWYGDKEG